MDDYGVEIHVDLETWNGEPFTGMDVYWRPSTPPPSSPGRVAWVNPYEDGPFAPQMAKLYKMLELSVSEPDAA